MIVERDRLKEAMVKVLDELPRERVSEVLDFTLFVKERGSRRVNISRGQVVPSVPAAQLNGLVGMVGCGRDALADTERLYDDNG